MNYRGPITTAVQFLAAFRYVKVLAVGSQKNICWIEADVDVDGTEEQFYFVMERREGAEVKLRHVQNPSSIELHDARSDPTKLWDRGYTPQHGDDCAW